MSEQLRVRSWSKELIERSLTFAGRTPFLRRRRRTGVFLYPSAITCKLKWVKVEKMKNHFRIYGMWIAKINGNKMRTLPHTHFLQTKHFWHHYFKIEGSPMETYQLSQRFIFFFGCKTLGEHYLSIPIAFPPNPHTRFLQIKALQVTTSNSGNFKVLCNISRTDFIPLASNWPILLKLMVVNWERYLLLISSKPSISDITSSKLRDL